MLRGYSGNFRSYGIISEKEFAGRLIMEKNKFKENLKWWVMGNLIFIFMGFTGTFFCYFSKISNIEISEEIFLRLISSDDWRVYPGLFFIPFVSAFTIKLIKRNLSWKFYSTIGIIPHIISFFSFLAVYLGFRIILEAN